MTTRSILPAFCLVSAFCIPSAFGALTLTMTGTIGTGTLNGTNIDGQFFTLTGQFLDGTDFFPDPGAAIFKMSGATMQVGSLQFDFDPDRIYSAQLIRTPGARAPTDYGFAILDRPEVFPMSNGFVFVRDSAPVPPFDPDVLSTLSFTGFDVGYAESPTTGPNSARFFNGSDSLLLTSSITTAGASVTIVPEPSTVGLLALVGLGLVITRRRSV